MRKFISIFLTYMMFSGTTAAYSVGYTDVFTFSKMFKIHYGVSPTEYVKNNKLHFYNAN